MNDVRKLTCHCGAVEMRVVLADRLENSHRCDCSFCRRRGAMANTAAYPDGIEIIKGADKLTKYQFNTQTAEHYFCSICGIFTHHRRRSNPNEYGINVGALEGVNPADIDPVPWSDGVNHPSDQQTR